MAGVRFAERFELTPSMPAVRRRARRHSHEHRSEHGGRAPDELRPVTIEPGFVRTATGSALISCGGTRVICTASVQESVPRWLAGQGRGWMTAEYGMLPASTGERKQRDVAKGRPDGRTVEIQRLIGRSLRGIADLDALGERTIYVDCDVLEADGGTRCASITGGYVALALACQRLQDEGLLTKSPLTGSIAAVSCGVVDGIPLLDLDYPEDSSAEVDANVVMTGEGGLVEVQATAERTPLSRAHLDELLALAQTGIEGLRARAGSGAALSPVRLAARDPQRAQAARVRAPAAGNPDRHPPRQRPHPRGDRRHVRRERADQGPQRRAGDPAAGLRRRLRHRGRGAANGAPASAPPASPDRTPPTRRTSHKLHNEAPAGSRARYVCVIAYVTPKARNTSSRAASRARSRQTPAATKGFGYDPIFIADETPGRTMADLDDDAKDAISHRGHAARELLAWLTR